jgi:hypothetical protein
MATGFPTKGTGGSATFVNGNSLPASDLNDLAGTLNYLSPAATKGVSTNFGETLVADASNANQLRWTDDIAILKIMDAI